MANFKDSSRYTNGIASKTRSGKYYLTLRQALVLPNDSTDTFITITQEYITRPDLISSNLYGSADYWWVIYEFNNINDPLFDLKISQVLRVPTLERILAAIASLGA